MTAKRLSDVCDFIRGVTFDKADMTNTPRPDYLPILRAGNINGDLDTRNDLVWVPPRNVADEQKLKKNDIVICMSSGSADVVGKTARVKSDYVGSIGSFCGIIRPKNPEIGAWLSYFFQSDLFRKHRDAIARGANIQNLRFSQLENIEIPIAPEQKRIAGILEKADRLRRTRRYAGELSDTFLQSEFLEMFGDPLQNSRNWNIEPLGEKLIFLTSGSRGWAKYYRQDGDLFLRIQNVGKNQLLLDDLTFVQPPKNAEGLRTVVQAGDVLLTITADLGRSAVVPKGLAKAYINQHLALLRFRGVDPMFAAALLSSNAAKRQWDSLDRSAVKSGLNFDDIRGFKMISPPLPLQQKFAAIVQRFERLRARQREAERQAEHLFQTLLHRAFDGGHEL